MARRPGWQLDRLIAITTVPRTVRLDTIGRVPIDVRDRVACLEASVRIRASLDPVDIVTWFTGSVYAYVHGEASHLFDVEGYNIGRSGRVDGGFDVLCREMMLYLDPVTGVVLDEFRNPFTGAVSEVRHRWNDPVGIRLRTVPPTPELVVVGDHLHLRADEFVAEPNPLEPRRWPVESSGIEYRHAECSRLIAAVADVMAGTASAPAQLVAVRIGPWLPWMGMGEAPGRLVYHVGGCKLDGYRSLPGELRRRVEDGHPEFMFAPATRTGPDETEWTAYAAHRRPQRTPMTGDAARHP